MARGRVVAYEPGGLIVVLAPIEGSVEQVIVPENLIVTWADGSRASPMEIAPGQTVDAEGELDALGRLVAQRIRLTPAEATATPEIPLPSATPWPSASDIPEQGWYGEYYDNPSLDGSPRMMREDAAIDFRWQQGSPAPDLPPDSFSVRWRGRWPLEQGGYRFYAYSDDGIRLWVDGKLLIDRWQDQPATLTHADIYLEAGEHDLRVEYYERQDAATARVWWDYRGPYPDWRGEYYANVDLVGEPALVRNDIELRFDWGKSSPAAAVPADRFSARWTRTLPFEGGAYRFFARADDGVRLWVDGPLVIDAWHDSIPATYIGHLWLDPGPHEVRVAFYENGGEAHLQVWWERIERFDYWAGAYYANPDLAGRPVFLRDDERIAFDWGSGSPGLGIPIDNYSVRWSRKIAFEGGIYRFWALADDGVRLYVDGNRQIDAWRDTGEERASADVLLSPGEHEIVVEYYERGERARIEVGWEQAPTLTPSPTASPTSTLTSTATEMPIPTAIPTATPSPSQMPTDTPSPTATETLQLPTATATQVPSTTTPPPIPTPQPTESPSSVLPTATATVAPTDTPIPSTATTSPTSPPPTIPAAHRK